MSPLNRRSFLKTLATTVPAAAASGCVLPGDKAATLDEDALRALAETVLPSELGADGIAAAAGGFQAWLAAYRPAAEMTHGYGTGEIEYTPAHPGPGWSAQLDALNLEARERFGRAFALLDLATRRDLVHRQLARDRSAALGDPATARHVAVGLLAYWTQTPGALNLCYEAKIDRNTCRPLAAQAVQPPPMGSRFGA